MVYDQGSEITVRVPGKFTWRNMFTIDQRGKSGTITQVYKTKEIRKFYNDEFSTSLKEKTKETKNIVGGKVTVGAEYEGVGVSTEVSSSKETSVKDFMSKYHRSQTTISQESETERTETYEVRGGDILSMYQEIYQSDGVEYSTGRVATQPEADREVSMLVKMKRVEYIGGIDVVYGNHADDAPADRIRTVDNNNDDMNAGQGGDYVWLVPRYTYSKDDALTWVEVFHQGSAAPGLDDLAKGAGGDFRYVKGVKNTREDRKIKKLDLVRDSDDEPELDRVTGAWAKSGDINHKRSGDFLQIFFS